MSIAEIIDFEGVGRELLAELALAEKQELVDIYREPADGQQPHLIAWSDDRSSYTIDPFTNPHSQFAACVSFHLH